MAIKQGSPEWTNMLHDLCDTLANRPDIEVVYFNENGEYFFHCHTWKGQKYSQLVPISVQRTNRLTGDKTMVMENQGIDKYLILEEKTREECLLLRPDVPYQEIKILS